MDESEGNAHDKHLSPQKPEEAGNNWLLKSTKDRKKEKDVTNY